MASVLITHLGAGSDFDDLIEGPIHLADIGITLTFGTSGNSPITITKPVGDISRMASLMALVDAGKVSTAVTLSAAELASGLATSDDSVQAGDVVGLNATSVELNNAADKSAQIQTLAGAGAITVDGTIRNVKVTGGAYAFTLDAPSAAMLGETLTIECTAGAGTDKTLSLAQVQGGTAATTATFNAVDETLILVGGTNKWNVSKEVGVTLS